MTLLPRHLWIAAALCGAAGVVLALTTYTSWRKYRSYTVEVDGVVSQRTATFVAVRFEGDIPGGHSSVEHPYSVLSGGRSNAPPEAAGLKLGDKVALIHPPGKPADARLAEGFRPDVPLWLGWVSAGLLLVAAAGIWIAWRWQRRRRAADLREAARSEPAALTGASL